jgi:hypothetical protein
MIGRTGPSRRKPAAIERRLLVASIDFPTHAEGPYIPNWFLRPRCWEGSLRGVQHAYEREDSCGRE